ncbi:hypothetical protein [Pseudoalteromonas aurantia]|uniref:Uncharacterized protein n=1 Tax=Pseudoalteromonas aurantia TaxID=43654 RepID=A0A5S3V6A1_9GAMM|nr:hypothetical protein [Pseudoalteromonas aurantia]TMO66615.1 hypothetical protein CWC19_15735 [Pseudoalteromonas aurantia]
MSLVIKDFDQQNVVSKDHVVRSIKRIPQHHMRGLRYVVYDKARFFQRSYEDIRSVNYQVLGTYNNLPNNFICIFKFSTVKEFEHILYHEVGHHVYQHVLTPKLRRQWVYELVNIYPGFISNYATKSPEEDFCECYAYFYTLPSRLQKFGVKYKFINAL